MSSHLLDSSHFEEARMDHLVEHVFKLTDLANMYSTRRGQLRSDVTGRVNSIRLKVRILAYFPDMEIYTNPTTSGRRCETIKRHPFAQLTRMW